MPHIIVIDKTGTIKSTNVKDVSAETLYKKAGLKSGENFKLQHTWNKSNGLMCSISLYAKTSPVRAGTENKYDFPPPVDNTLFFGSCVIVRQNLELTEVQDLKEPDWNEIYESLFGGFEDIGVNDSEDESENDDDDVGGPRTKQNYVKDGFVVDDDECDDDVYLSEEEEEEKPIRKTKPRKNATQKHSVPTQNPNPIQTTQLIEDRLDDELVEEEYHVGLQPA